MTRCPRRHIWRIGAIIFLSMHPTYAGCIDASREDLEMSPILHDMALRTQAHAGRLM